MPCYQSILKVVFNNGVQGHGFWGICLIYVDSQGHLVEEVCREKEFDASLDDEIDGPGKSCKVYVSSICISICRFSTMK